MKSSGPLLSIVIPSYNASGTIRRALTSIRAPLTEQQARLVEIIVVDDGGADHPELSSAVTEFEQATLVAHQSNRGMCAARNTGLTASHGQFVTLLDADDFFVDDWFSAFEKILQTWPQQANVCYTPCVNQHGKITSSSPGYVGWLTAADMAQERFSGEYNPIFRGPYVRDNLYADIGLRKSCGTLTYLRMARIAPFWITNVTMRIYNEGVGGSVTAGWTKPPKALETERCFAAILQEHGDFIRETSTTNYWKMRYKLLVYRMLSREGRDIVECLRSFSLQALPQWMATLMLLIAGRQLTVSALLMAKKLGALRRYG